MSTEEVLALLRRLEAAGDITAADRERISGHWCNERRAASSAEAEYWSLRLLRDLGRALGADDLAGIDERLRAAEDALVRTHGI